MPQIMEAHVWQPRSFDQFVEGSEQVARINRCAKVGGKHEAGLLPAAAGKQTLLKLADMMLFEDRCECCR